MDRYYWKENEYTIAKSLCDLCEFQNKECNERCAKYESKPKDVLSNDIKCPFFSRKRKIKL